MKLAAVVGVSVLGLLLGTAPAYADHGHDQENHGRGDDHHGGPQRDHGNDARNDHGHQAAPQHGEYHQANRPEARHDVRPPEHQQAYRPEVHQPHYRPADEHVREYRHEPHGPTHDVWSRERAGHWEREHRSWHDRGGYVGYRIPPDRFREHFGRGHWFRVYGAPMVVVEGRPRFQYSGLWFSIVDPYPETWAPNWYQTDDVYVDYVNDGYYLCNRSHPGVHIAVNVSF